MVNIEKTKQKCPLRVTSPLFFLLFFTKLIPCPEFLALKSFTYWKNRIESRFRLLNLQRILIRYYIFVFLVDIPFIFFISNLL